MRALLGIALYASSGLALCACSGLALCACSGQAGVLSVSLTTAPGSLLLDNVQTLQVTLTQPRQVFTAQRTSSGFDLSLELPATGEAAALLVDGIDGAGTVVATGASPPFPLGAINGSIVIYMAIPNSVGAAPHSLDPPRAQVGAAPLPYGVLFAGGLSATGAPSDDILIYNAYDHSLAVGKPLPAARAGIQVAIGTGNIAYLFGGRDDQGNATASLWRFDTTAAPDGSYNDFGEKSGFARADQLMLPIGNDHFLLTGSPAAELDALDGSLVASDIASLPASGASVVASDGVRTSIFAGPEGIVRYRDGTFETLPIDDRRGGAGVVALPDGKVAIVCGAPDALRIDAASGSAELHAGVPGQTKSGCATAATARHLIVAGGTLLDGTIDSSAAIYDARTLAPIATVPLVVARTGAIAIALPNNQIMIASGVDDHGAPIGTIELFTPPAS